MTDSWRDCDNHVNSRTRGDRTQRRLTSRAAKTRRRRRPATHRSLGATRAGERERLLQRSANQLATPENQDVVEHPIAARVPQHLEAGLLQELAERLAGEEMSLATCSMTESSITTSNDPCGSVVASSVSCTTWKPFSRVIAVATADGSRPATA